MKTLKKGGLFYSSPFKSNDFDELNTLSTKLYKNDEEHIKTLRHFVDILRYEELREFLSILEIEDRIAINDIGTFLNLKEKQYRQIQEEELRKIIYAKIILLPEGLIYFALIYLPKNIFLFAYNQLKKIFSNIGNVILYFTSLDKEKQPITIIYFLYSIFIFVKDIVLLLALPLLSPAQTIQSYYRNNIKRKRITEYIKQIIESRLQELEQKIDMEEMKQLIIQQKKSKNKLLRRRTTDTSSSLRSRSTRGR